MTEGRSIELFRLLNEALEVATDPGSIALLEAVKFHETHLVLKEDLPLPIPATGIPCGCDDPATCEDRDDSCPPLTIKQNGGIAES